MSFVLLTADRFQLEYRIIIYFPSVAVACQYPRQCKNFCRFSSLAYTFDCSLIRPFYFGRKLSGKNFRNSVCKKPHYFVMSLYARQAVYGDT